MKKNIFQAQLFVALLLLSFFQSSAQDIQYVRKQLDRLCSPEFHGRAYYNKGDNLAAAYLSDQFTNHGLSSFEKDYLQHYSFNVNSLEEVSVKINGEQLEFGKDFMMNASSGSLSGSFKPLFIDAPLMKNPRRLFDAMEEAGKNRVVILDSLGLNNPELYRFVKSLALEGKLGISGLIEVYPRTPIGRVGSEPLPVAHIQLSREAMPPHIGTVEINVKNKYYDKYPTSNVIGFIPGQTDKYIVFTAHYDMCGSFGEGNYFPGASDNGSGTAMVLDLARHFASGEKPYYSIAFMLFSGEERGLMGSTNYVNNPLFPLEKIKLAINLDMVGTGQNGVILFNAQQRPLEAAIVQKINEEKHYMKEVEEKPGTANSDHWPFHKKEVPAIFFLTKGQSAGIHNIYDTVDKLALYGYENLFKLTIDLTTELQKQEAGR
ncbi:MAG: M28 family peptidase [Bacteroidetes bacterium]|nr:M28 family peptidase [Bacteroidota bacterium]